MYAGVVKLYFKIFENAYARKANQFSTNLFTSGAEELI